MPGFAWARQWRRGTRCRKPVSPHEFGDETTVAGNACRRSRMTSKNTTIAVAVLDDYQGAALRLADWSAIDGRAAVTVFTDHLSDTDAVIERLKGFDVL